MFDFLSNLVTPVGEGSAPLVEIFKTALKAPFVYFIGLALLGAIIGVVKSLKR